MSSFRLVMSHSAVRVKRTAASDGNDETTARANVSSGSTQTPASQVHFHQPLERRLKTRQSYRNLRTDTHDNRDQYIQPSVKARSAIRQALEEADRLFEEVKMPREGALDASFLCLTTKMMMEQAERLTSGFRSYDPAIFVAEICKMLEEPKGVEQLAHKARAYTLTTDCAQFMLGPMDIEIKPRKVRERRAKDVIAETSRPEEVQNMEADMKNEATKRVEVIHENLLDRMNFWEFVFDGTEDKGFARTIENIFYASFLIRDGHAGIEVENGIPIIFKQTAPTDEDWVEHKVDKHQCIMQFDYNKWLSLRNLYGDHSYLPPPTQQPLETPIVRSSQTASSNKRNFATMDSMDDDLVSQVADTPEYEMPKSKRPKHKR